MKKRAKRAKNLSKVDVEAIISVLAGWTGKLTWGDLIDKVQLQLFQRYTRQALHKHARIRNAFRLKQTELRNRQSAGGGRPRSIELQVALDRTKRLESELAELRLENDRLLEQFARGVYNANTRGLTREYLDRPLVVISRARTR